MKIGEKLTSLLHSITTGSSRRKIILTPILGSGYVLVTCLFVIIPIKIDYGYNFLHLWSSPYIYLISFPLFIIGIILVVWPNYHFIRAKGTPVPVNPPSRLILNGPFKYSRNPMTSGYFFIMFGFGIYYNSLLSILIFTPVFIFIHVMFFKNVEEPELEKRFGAEYADYKKRVPMFFPRLKLLTHKSIS